MRTAHLLPYGGGGVSPTETLPQTETPWTETPPVMWPVVRAGTGHPPVNRMTHRCKNITWPQTSFAGGNNVQ